MLRGVPDLGTALIDEAMEGATLRSVIGRWSGEVMEWVPPWVARRLTGASLLGILLHPAKDFAETAREPGENAHIVKRVASIGSPRRGVLILHGVLGVAREAPARAQGPIVAGI